jgi:hypothetical protein
MKWMNCAGATTNYPTDGRGGRDGTAGNSTFADGKGWDNKACVAHGLYFTAGANVATLAITGHDGSATPLGTITLPANGIYEADLHGVQLLGLKAVTTGATAAATIFFDVGQNAGY